MPRIAHVISTPQGIGGAEKVAAAIVEGANNRGWKQLVLNPFAAPNRGNDLELLFESATFSAAPCASVTKLLPARRWLKGELKEFGPDIVHVHLFHAMLLVGTLKKQSASRILTHHHGGLWDVQGRNGRKLLDRVGGHRYDIIVAVSESVRQFLLTEYGYSPDHVRLIRNGWGGASESKVTPEWPTAICVANFRREKRHRDLIAAFTEVVKALPEAQLVLIGDGPLRIDLIEQTRAFGLQKHIHFAGTVQNVWDHLRRATVFVLASEYETAGISIMEAMASELPVIAPNVGAVPELVSPGITGDLYRPGDVSALHQYLLRALLSPHRSAERGRRAAESVSELHAEKMVKHYLDLYEDLICG